MQLLKHVEAATRRTTSTAPLRTTTTTTTSTTTTQALGCMDKKACNFDSGAQIDDESCKFPSDKNHDCKGKCTAKVDNCGICGGKGMGKDKTKCSNNKFFGDDYCDDGNNNCACGTEKIHTHMRRWCFEVNYNGINPLLPHEQHSVSTARILLTLPKVGTGAIVAETALKKINGARSANVWTRSRRGSRPNHAHNLAAKKPSKAIAIVVRANSSNPPPVPTKRLSFAR